MALTVTVFVVSPRAQGAGAAPQVPEYSPPEIRRRW